MKQLLCFGDSNVWGIDPVDWHRLPWGERWTSILQEKLGSDIRVLEQGLCGRTIASDDPDRENKNALKILPMVLDSQSPLDGAVIMMGTNDCKACFGKSAADIAHDAGKCLDLLLGILPADRIILISPIHLGEKVWLPEYDPAFDKRSIEVSKHLKEEYQKIAAEKGVHFLAASDIAQPSSVDYEHLEPSIHPLFADFVYAELLKTPILGE